MIHAIGSVVEGALLVFVSIVLWKWWPTKHLGDAFSVILMLAGVCGLLGTAPAGWIHSWITWLNDWLTAEFTKWGWGGVIVMGALALAALILLIVMLHPKGKLKISMWSLVIAAFLPFTAAMIPGALGVDTVSAIVFIAHTVQTPLAWLGV